MLPLSSQRQHPRVMGNRNWGGTAFALCGTAWPRGHGVARPVPAAPSWFHIPIPYTLYAAPYIHTDPLHPKSDPDTKGHPELANATKARDGPQTVSGCGHQPCYHIQDFSGLFTPFCGLSPHFRVYFPIFGSFQDWAFAIDAVDKEVTWSGGTKRRKMVQLPCCLSPQPCRGN